MGQPDDHRLQRIADRLAGALHTTHEALGKATAVLLGEDAEAGMKGAEQALHDLRAQIEDLLPAAPVPGGPDARATVAVVHIGGDLDRVAELTREIAEIAWSRHTRQPLPEPLTAVMDTMSGATLDLVARSGTIAALDSAAAVETAAGLDRDLGTVAAQQRVLDEVLACGDPPLGAADVVDATLLGRCYEGCARHAVSAARHVAMLAS